MRDVCRPGRINVKAVIILLVVVGLLGAGAAVGYKVRKRMIANAALAEGQAAFDREDWETAGKQLRRYLSKYPDDIEILKQYAEAELSIRPLEPSNIGGAIGAYRRLLRQERPAEMSESSYEEMVRLAYEQLAKLYEGTGNFGELAHVAENRLADAPDDPRATIWLATARISQRRFDEAGPELEALVERLERQSQKGSELVDACTWLAYIAAQGETSAAGDDTLGWLNRAIAFVPDSANALVRRAIVYREPPTALGETVDREAALAAARKDLDSAAALAPSNPRVRLLLSAEWIAHGKLYRHAGDEQAANSAFDRAAAGLEAAADVNPQMLEEYYLDPTDRLESWFCLSAELAVQRGTLAEGVALADEVVSPLDRERATLKHTRHRVTALPFAIELYVLSGRIEEAQLCLDEYLDATATEKRTPEAEEQVSFLKANLARARNQPYQVIELLEPVVARNASLPGAWRMLAEAFNKTNQPRRAVSALNEYVRLQPEDAGMTMELAQAYRRLGDWPRALDAVRRAESLRPANVGTRLLRIAAEVQVAIQQAGAEAESRIEALSAELASLRESHPDRATIHLLQAMIAAHEGSEEALTTMEEDLKRFIAKGGDTLPLEMQLLRIYAVTEQSLKALEFVGGVCERHPDVAEPWITRSELHRASDQLREAREALESGLASVQDPLEKRKLVVALAMFDIQHGQGRQSGIDRLKTLASQDKRDVQVRALLLELPEGREDPAYAQQLVDELKEAEGSGGLLWRLYQASVWLSGDEYRTRQQEMSDLLSQCITADPQWSAPVLLLGGMHARLGDWDRAQAVYRSALQQNPSALPVADRLLSLLYRQGRPAEARAVLSGLEINPRALAGRRIGVALREGNIAEALHELRLSGDPEDADTLILLAQLVYLEERDADAAFDYLDEAEAASPDSLALTAARVWILDGENRPDEARSLLDELVARENSPGAYALRARHFVSSGELDLAEKDYLELSRFPGNNRGYLRLSEFYRQNDRLDDAIAALERGCEAYPDDLELKGTLMNALFFRAQGDDRQRAAALLTVLEGKLPDAPDVLWARARAVLSQRGADAAAEAEGLLRRVVQRRPDHVDAHLALISIALARRDYAAARDAATAALGSNPGNSPLLLARAGAERALNRPRLAWEQARQVLSADPQKGAACRTLIGSALDTGDAALLEETRAALTEELGKYPESEPLQLGLAKILHALGQTDSAIAGLEAYRQAGGQDGSVEVLLTLADLCRARGDLDTSQERIETAAALAPDSPAVLLARINWLTAKRQFDEIVTLAADCRARQTENLELIMTAASALAASDQKRHRDEARRLFEHATEVAPGFMGARHALAMLAYEEGDLAGARELFRAILAEDPANAAALNDLAWILAEAGRDDRATLEEAFGLANRAVGFQPDNVHFLDTRGVILSRLPGRLQAARADLEKCVQLAAEASPRRARAALKLGRVCVGLRDLTEARRHLGEAKRIDEDQGILTTDERRELGELLQEAGAEGDAALMTP